MGKIKDCKFKPATAAGPWQTGPAPKDGRKILGIFGSEIQVVYWKWIDPKIEGWYAPYASHTIDPYQWAEIYEPKEA